MPLFTYKVRDKDGRVTSGVLEAANKRTVIEKLRAQNYFIASIEEETPTAELLTLDIGELFVSVKTKDMVIFTNQLATMIGSGLTLTSSLNVLTQQIENKKLRKIIEKVRDDVEGGNSFSGALEKHPRVFSSLFVNMVHAGETGGALEEILRRLATFAEQAEDLRANVKTAMTYPILILFVAVGVITFLVTGILPKFENIFLSSNVPLPMPTVLLLTVSRFIRTKWYMILFVMAVVVIGMYLYNRTKEGRFNLDAIKLKIPVFGSLLRKVAIARFARTLGTLISSGVPILQSLRIVQATVGNFVIASVIDNVCESVNKGESIAGPLQEGKVFPVMVGQMVAVGEEAGTLDEVLNKIADFYDKEVGFAVKALSSVIEPVLIFFVGGLVGLVALALFLPMFNMIQVIK
ncbi:MAG: type II secretion system F family protein [Candidatus Omnitrophica bacterium]|nr:type II secretion system F family protein [Candidatus Omnitrophota bacterium]